MTESATYPHIRVSGAPHDRGRQYGEAARDRIALSLAGYAEVFAGLVGWDWDRVRTTSAAYVPAIEAYEPRYLDEIRGIAEGAAVPVEDILALNVRTEIMFAAYARQSADDGTPPAMIPECSSFAALPPASGGGTLIGQNWDWTTHCFDTVVVLEVEQPDGPNYVTVPEAGLLAKLGFNASGLGLAVNTIMTPADCGALGVPYHIVARAVLDARTISDGLAAIQRARRASSGHWLLAHRDGLAVSVETAPGDYSRVFLVFPEDEVVLHTNHFVSSAFDDKDVSRWSMPDSPFRLERLRQQVRAWEGDLTLDFFGQVLSDHANHPGSVCCHPRPDVAAHESFGTIASVLMDLDKASMRIADGPPCETPFRELNYADFFGERNS